MYFKIRWSFGILMYEIITMGGIPYPGMKRNALTSFLKEKKFMDRPNECPASVYDVMRACWKYAPKDRPDFGKVIEMLSKALDQKKQVTQTEKYMLFSFVFLDQKRIL